MSVEWLSIVPFSIVIALSIWLKRILPGLVLGVLAGSILLKAGWLSASDQAVTYMVETLSDETNIKIIGFLYLFGGLVGMMTISGGIKGFSEWIGGKIHSQRSLLGLIWLTLPFTFMMPMFRIMMIGPVVKSLLGKWSISRQKVGFTMDVSTSSVIVLLPVATAFVGFMVSLVENGIHKNGLEMSAYSVFLMSIPFNFFAIIMLLFGLARTFWTSKAIEKEPHKDEGDEDHPFHRSSIDKELSLVKAQPWNLIVPLFLLLGLSLYLLWQDGRAKGAITVFDAFTQADATFVMLLAVFLTLTVTFLFYAIRKLPLNELLYHFVDGGNQMMQAIILLILVWALSLNAEDLGFSQFVSSTLGSFLPAFTIPAILFVLGSTVGYFIGSSWGTWGLFMPLGFSLAAATDAPIIMTVGAVFASGSFGAMTSPLGDTTITTASIMELPLVEYAYYKLKFCAAGAGVATLCYLAAGFFYA
ncbi:sodium:proton antiporter [Sediminibacillus dalangtanensis]|uniref:Sodium:proton antiporter n=1 Tax=Sediminibacillus dalangtanensis TaxID=2729421 RepID=A0ABX7VRF8_9BACI|nr:Na+/H+ antiporter NhaC family protein [Sediminibacillus dalangtanensis]QTM99113.1 sodium:proton antiporter [Sediminibacillus dalangtanensis]